MITEFLEGNIKLNKLKDRMLRKLKTNGMFESASCMQVMCLKSFTIIKFSIFTMLFIEGRVSAKASDEF